MAKSIEQADVLVLGCHPSALLAVLLLREAGVTVRHASLAGDCFPDRLVTLHPAFFDLHTSLAEIKPAISLTDTSGLRFLADDFPLSSSYAADQVTTSVGRFRQIQSAIQKRAKIGSESAPLLQVHGVDDAGVELTIGKRRVRSKLILLAGELPADARRELGLPDRWEAGVVRRYSFVCFKRSKAMPTEPHADKGKWPQLVMSLDLCGTSSWAWLHWDDTTVQLALEQPIRQVARHPSAKLLQDWANLLARHEVIGTLAVKPDNVESIDLPFAGALAQELVANRTLLFGPAGGFISNCGDELYPCCWSAKFAVEAALSALKERFVQDGLQQYRQKWGGSLGGYLQGPQQNLRFLLPLVYRNPMMATRLGAAIVSGQGLVQESKG